MKAKFLTLPLAVLFTSSSIAADFTWKGTTDSTWTDNSNWLAGTAPVYGTTYNADRLFLGSGGAAAGAVYNPPGGETTTFGSGRGIVIGSTSQGPAGLTISAGTLKINGPNTVGNEPIMGNGVSATLVLNGGNLDLTGHGNGFRLMNTGGLGLTSELSISNGTFSCGTFDFFTGGTDGTSTVNLDANGVLAVTRFSKTATAVSSTLNLDGGTLRARNTQTSPNFFLADLLGLQAIVEDGGVIVDSNTFNLTISEALEHDSSLGEDLDGGLTKISRGSLTLNGNNTFTGGVTINAGIGLATGETSRVLLGHDSAAGTGTITMADSFTDVQLALNRNIANPLVVSNTGNEKTMIFVNSGGAEYSGTITINETNIDHFRVRSDANCNLTLSGLITGAGGIYKFQSGNTTITNGFNDFTGGVKINQGTITFSSGSLGTTGDITMDGGTLRWSTGNTEDVSARLKMVDAKIAILNTNGNDVNLATGFGNSSTGALTKLGVGTLTLGGAASFTGATTVNGGTLIVNGSLAVGSAVTVTTGKLGGVGTIGGDVTIAAPANLAPGGLASTLTITGGLDVSAMTAGAGKMEFELDSLAGPNDLLVVGGTLTLGSLALDDVAVINLGFLEAGTYTLITSGGITGTVDETPAEIVPGFNGKLQISGNNLVLVVTAVGTDNYSTWATANGITGEPFGGDFDKDGISNGIEYALGLNPSTPGQAPGSLTGNTLSFTKGTEAIANGDVSWIIESSTTLQAGSWSAEVTQPAGDPATTISYTFTPGTPDEKFARLKIIQNP